MPKTSFLKIALIGCCIVFCFSFVFAFDDGFGSAKSLETSHFTLYYSSSLNLEELKQRLNIGLSDRLLAGQSISSSGDLAAMLDALFTRVCDILDMQLYSLKSNIKVCRDDIQLADIFANLFNRDLGKKRSFYVSDLNTIYVSVEGFNREILGHEIGHAIISRYFVVLPSVKVQEVLSSYVEYQLRQSTQP